MTVHNWQFTSYFRRKAFGWRSALPIQRIKEALTEIKQVSRKEPVLAAEGAVILLEKLAPALQGVDSSSGALGSAVRKAIETLVPIIVKAEVDVAQRQLWLERLWRALQEDEMPYLESLGEDWGALCKTPELATKWADTFLTTVASLGAPGVSEWRFLKESVPCLSALFAARRYDELLQLIERNGFKSWFYRHWGVKALAAQGKVDEAIQYAEASRGINEARQHIAQACEAILLSSGMVEKAYQCYAIDANQATTNLATFRAILKKYPKLSPQQVLQDLVASTPGEEGKWFAAAKDAGFFDLAIELITVSPTDPRTLIRAARDYGETQADFALKAGLAALYWIAHGHGYEITSVEVGEAYAAVTHAATKAGVASDAIKAQIKQMSAFPNGQWLCGVLVTQHRFDFR